MPSRRVYFTTSIPDPQSAVIVDNPDRIGKKIKKVESLGNKVSLVKGNSLPNKLSSLQDIEFDLNFEQYLLRTKS